MADALQLLLPPGRIIMGDVYKGSDKDSKGVPRTVKSGPNKGQQVTLSSQLLPEPIADGGYTRWMLNWRSLPPCSFKQ